MICHCEYDKLPSLQMLKNIVVFFQIGASFPASKRERWKEKQFQAEKWKEFSNAFWVGVFRIDGEY